jgi:hypothetical protein
MKKYHCEKCGSLASEAFQDKWFAQQFGKVCVYCADFAPMDTFHHAEMSRMADAEMGDL